MSVSFFPTDWLVCFRRTVLYNCFVFTSGQIQNRGYALIIFRDIIASNIPFNNLFQFVWTFYI